MTSRFHHQSTGIAIAGLVVFIALLAAGIIAASLLAGGGSKSSAPFGQQLTKKKSINIDEADLRTPYDVLEVHLQYNKSNNSAVAITSVTKKTGFAPKYYPYPGSYEARLVDENGAILKTVPFNIPTTFEDIGILNGATTKGSQLSIDRTNVALTIPTNNRVKQVRILNPFGQQLTTQAIANGKSPLLISFLRELTVSTVFAQSSREYLDIVFVSNNYSSMATFQADVTQIKEALLSYEPFASRKQVIKFATIENTADLACAKLPQLDRVLRCDAVKVTQRVNDAKVPYDQIIVLAAGLNYGGSGVPGTSITYATSGPETPHLVVHEFGHTFGGLLDEYTFGKDGPIDNTVQANCLSGPPPAAKWQGIVNQNDYAKECTHNNWYRSSQTSIMQTLSTHQFNKISQQLLSEKLTFFSSPDGPLPTATPPSQANASNAPQPIGATPTPQPGGGSNCSSPTITGSPTDNATTFSITGIVYLAGSLNDYSNRFKGCATITLKRNGLGFATVQTDSTDGTYGFTGLPTDNYEIELSVPSGHTVNGANPQRLDNLQSSATLINFGLR